MTSKDIHEHVPSLVHSGTCLTCEQPRESRHHYQACVDCGSLADPRKLLCEGCAAKIKAESLARNVSECCPQPGKQDTYTTVDGKRWCSSCHKEQARKTGAGCPESLSDVTRLNDDRSRPVQDGGEGTLANAHAPSPSPTRKVEPVQCFKCKNKVPLSEATTAPNGSSVDAICKPCSEATQTVTETEALRAQVEQCKNVIASLKAQLRSEEAPTDKNLRAAAIAVLEALQWVGNKTLTDLHHAVYGTAPSDQEVKDAAAYDHVTDPDDEKAPPVCDHSEVLDTYPGYCKKCGTCLGPVSEATPSDRRPIWRMRTKAEIEAGVESPAYWPNGFPKGLEEAAEKFAQQHPQITGNNVDTVCIPFHRHSGFIAGAAWATSTAPKDNYCVEKLRDRLRWVIKHLEGGCDQEAAILEAKDGLAESETAPADKKGTPKRCE